MNMDIFELLKASSVITDMRNNYSALIAAIVMISFILMGLDRVRELLLEWHDSNLGNKIDKEFGGSIGGELVRYNRLAKKYRGAVAGDLYASRYRQGIRDYGKEDELIISDSDDGYRTHEQLGYEPEIASNSGDYISHSGGHDFEDDEDFWEYQHEHYGDKSKDSDDDDRL